MLLVEPYKSEILPLWRFRTPALARRSSAAILRRFREYRRKSDFVGMDMARKFLQMGYTRARRYANYRGGRKYAARGTRVLPRGGDPVKAQSASIFYSAWREAAADLMYQRLMKEHRQRGVFLASAGDTEAQPDTNRSSQMAKSRGTPNAIELLKDDHARVKQSFKEFEKLDQADTATLQEMVRAVCAELKVHTTIEEEIFYPAVREAIEDEDLMNEATVEHASAKDLIEQLEGMKADDPMLSATFTVLGEYVLHHVKEEESEMFPQVRKAELDLDDLGAKMKARKEQLTAETTA